MKKLQIICFHGYGTNALFMQKQSETFTKSVKSLANFHFIDGPYEAPDSFILDNKVIELIEGKHLSTLPHHSPKFSPQKFMASLSSLKQKIEQLGIQFDGIMGFSQGAVVTNLLVRLKAENIIDWKPLRKVRFCILLSGNHWKWQFLQKEHIPLDLPSLHFISEEDFLFSHSLLTTTHYQNPAIISHSYGHRIPKLGIKEKKTLRNFLRTYGYNHPHPSL